MPLPIVCIIGRPNVGKSTLFNRVLRRRAAVVDPTPGVTRDRHYAVAEWGGRSFALVDTGGLVMQTEEEMQRQVATQARIAIDEADVVLFIADGVAGVHEDDAAIARLILRAKKPAVFAVNKIDSDRRDENVWPFARLGPFPPLAISALNGRAVDELFDAIAAQLPESPAEEPANQADQDSPIQLAIVGRPNSGKSSLVNRLLGEARMIVSPIPGTTRDAVDTALEYDGRPYSLIDTAGLRRSARVTSQLEFYTTLRSIRAIHRADVACVLLDAGTELSAQDFKIAETVSEAGRGLFFAVNKWDLIEKDTHTAGTYVHDLKARGRTFAWAPVVFISALTGQRAVKSLEMAASIRAELHKRIPTSELNGAILPEIAQKPPPAVKGRHIKINYLTQVQGSPPTFVLFCNHPDSIGAAYQRYLMNRMRDRFGFSGVPIRLRFRKKGA